MSGQIKLEAAADAARQRLSELKARADRAEAACAAHESVGREIMAERDQALACCAEMRSIMESFVPGDPIATQQLTRALSLDCGKGWLPPDRVLNRCREFADIQKGEMIAEGWLSPEKAKELEARMLFLESAAVCYEARIAALKARNQRLVDALKAIRDHRQLTVEPTAEGFQTIAREALAANQKEQP